MIFELAQDFHDAVATMPSDHPRHRTLELLEEAIHRDIHFIARHPTTLFQCMWNMCWWYDCPEIGAEITVETQSTASIAKQKYSDPQMYEFLESYRIAKKKWMPHMSWVRAIDAPHIPLGTRLVTLDGHWGNDYSFDFSRDNRLLITGCIDYTVASCTGLRDTTSHVWEIESGHEIARYTGHKYGVCAVALSPDGLLAASAGCGTADSDVHIWRIDSQQCIQKFDKTEQCSLRFTASGKWLVCVDCCSTVDIRELKSNGNYYSEIKFAYKYETMHSSSLREQEKAINWWNTRWWCRSGFLVDTPGGWLDFEFRDGSQWEHHSMYIPDCPNQVVITAQDVPKGYKLRFPNRFIKGSLTWWLRKNAKALGVIRTLVSCVVSGMQSRSNVRELRRILDECRRKKRGYVAYSPNKRYIVHSCDLSQGPTVVYDAKSAKELARLQYSGPSRAVFSNDSTLLALAGENKGVWVWDWQNALPGMAFSQSQDITHEFRMEAQEGGKYAACSRGDSLEISVRGTGEVICRLCACQAYTVGSNGTRPRFDVRALAQSPDGTKLVWAQYNRGVRIWNIGETPPTRYMTWLPEGLKMEYHSGELELPHQLAFSSDGCRVAGTNDLTHSLWLASTGKRVTLGEGYVQPAILAEGPSMFPYRTRVVKRGTRPETIIEYLETYISGWLPEVTPSLGDPSGKAKWAFRITNSNGVGIYRRYVLEKG